MSCWDSEYFAREHMSDEMSTLRRESFDPEIEVHTPDSPEASVLKGWVSTVQNLRFMSDHTEDLPKAAAARLMAKKHLTLNTEGKELHLDSIETSRLVSPLAKGLELPSRNSFRSVDSHQEFETAQASAGRSLGVEEADSPRVSGARSPGAFDLASGGSKRRLSQDTQVLERLAVAKACLPSLDFDVTTYHPSEHVELMLEMFVQRGLCSRLGVPEAQIREFLWVVELHMFENPYHNWEHVVDVTQALYSMALSTHIFERLSDIEAFALLMSIVCHDLEHPGVSNLTLLNDKIFPKDLYSESSLEGYHARRAVNLLTDEGFGVTRFLTEEQSTTFLSIVRSNILATEMSRHNDYLAELQEVLDSGAECPVPLAMQLLMKCADISNAVRPLEVAEKWAIRVTNEFFRQGDLEQTFGLPVSAICDKTLKSRSEIQRGFIDFVIGPLFKRMFQAFPGLQPVLDRLWENRKGWADCEDEQLCVNISFSSVYH